MSEENLDGLAANESTETLSNETSEAPVSTTPEPVKAHPAHEKLLSELPEAWHAKVTPHLQEWDRNVQTQLEKYTPYKQFVEEGVDPNFIVQSMQLARAIADDPVTVHGNLTNALMQQGLLREEAEQYASEIMDENGEMFEDEDLPDNIRKELSRRDAELDYIKEQLSAQEFEKATEYELQAIQVEFNQLDEAYEVSPQQERAILELMDAAVARGEDLSVFQAAKKLVEITGVGFRKKGAPDLSGGAPTVIGGSGGNSVPFEGVEIPKDDRAKKEMLAQMFKNNAGQR
jgi:hypothetical protein